MSTQSSIARSIPGGSQDWCDLRHQRAAPGLNDGMSFFQKALAEKVITVPGQFFDINPGNRRQGRASRFERHV